MTSVNENAGSRVRQPVARTCQRILQRLVLGVLPGGSIVRHFVLPPGNMSHPDAKPGGRDAAPSASAVEAYCLRSGQTSLL